MALADDIKAKQAALDQAITDAAARVAALQANSMTQADADAIKAQFDVEIAAVNAIAPAAS